MGDPWSSNSLSFLNCPGQRHWQKSHKRQREKKTIPVSCSNIHPCACVHSCRHEHKYAASRSSIVAPYIKMSDWVERDLPVFFDLFFYKVKQLCNLLKVCVFFYMILSQRGFTKCQQQCLRGRQQNTSPEKGKRKGSSFPFLPPAVLWLDHELKTFGFLCLSFVHQFNRRLWWGGGIFLGWLLAFGWLIIHCTNMTFKNYSIFQNLCLPQLYVKNA